MLKSLPVSLRAAVFALLAVAFHACTPHLEELPTPAASPALTVRDAQNWYQSTYPTAALPSGPQPGTASANATAANGSGATPPVLVWAHARTLGQGNQQLVLVPLAGDRALFADRRWQGTRYLIVARNAAQALNGNVVELLLRRTSTPVDTLALFSDLYRGLVSGQPAAPAQGEGLVMLYSADYRYLTGRRFRNGRLLPGASRLAFLPYRGDVGNKNTGKALGTPPQSRLASGSACTDWYDVSTGAYIMTTGNCTFYVDNGSYDPSLIDYGNSGNPADIMLNGPGGYGGDLSGGGTGSAVYGDTPELRVFEADYRTRMSASELVIFDGMTRTQQVAFLINAQMATARAEAEYPGPGLHNGNGDAFRHALFSALNTVDLGAVLAKSLGDAHENRPNLTPLEELEVRMDLHNNEQGRNIIGTTNFPEGGVINLLNGGSLRIIENGTLVPSRP
jgi:hypothetical protein